MTLSFDTQRDGTVSFLPHRLNRQPVIVRGLTADELWICVALSATAGLLLGIPLAWLASSVALLPTVIVAAVAAGVFFCGGFIRRRKRGRPDTWLYRQLQWRMAVGFPLLAVHVGGRRLITRHGRWSTQRSRGQA